MAIKRALLHFVNFFALKFDVSRERMMLPPDFVPLDICMKNVLLLSPFGSLNERIHGRDFLNLPLCYVRTLKCL